MEETQSSKKSDRYLIKKMTMSAMFAALAYVLTLVAHFLHLSIMPGLTFLTYDPKDIIICISGFVLGPWYAVGVSVVVSFIEMITISSTAFYGLIMNIISTCALVVPAALVYHYKKDFKGALLSLAVGFVTEIIIMTLWNIIITPIYMNVPRDVLVQNYLLGIIIFNVIKVGINIAMILILYKPITSILRATRLLAPSNGPKIKETTILMISIGAMLLLVLVLIWILIKKFG